MEMKNVLDPKENMRHLNSKTLPSGQRSAKHLGTEEAMNKKKTSAPTDTYSENGDMSSENTEDKIPETKLGHDAAQESLTKNNNENNEHKRIENKFHHNIIKKTKSAKEKSINSKAKKGETLNGGYIKSASAYMSEKRKTKMNVQEHPMEKQQIKPKDMKIDENKKQDVLDHKSDTLMVLKKTTVEGTETKMKDVNNKETDLSMKNRKENNEKGRQKKSKRKPEKGRRRRRRRKGKHGGGRPKRRRRKRKKHNNKVIKGNKKKNPLMAKLIIFSTRLQKFLMRHNVNIRKIPKNLRMRDLNSYFRNPEEKKKLRRHIKEAKTMLKGKKRHRVKKKGKKTMKIFKMTTKKKGGKRKRKKNRRKGGKRGRNRRKKRGRGKGKYKRKEVGKRGYMKHNKNTERGDAKNKDNLSINKRIKGKVDINGKQINQNRDGENNENKKDKLLKAKKKETKMKWKEEKKELRKTMKKELRKRLKEKQRERKKNKNKRQGKRKKRGRKRKPNKKKRGKKNKRKRKNKRRKNPSLTLSKNTLRTRFISQDPSLTLSKNTLRTRFIHKSFWINSRTVS
ncbi:hypothetical protein SK128_012567 [Halocaridina rubra]|uniref:Uncharacterized protein n=1 Tax=Halocaridina rubra TaxID=373956 RepID=A0AAN8WLK6_HALRR